MTEELLKTRRFLIEMDLGDGHLLKWRSYYSGMLSAEQAARNLAERLTDLFGMPVRISRLKRCAGRSRKDVLAEMPIISIKC